VVHFATERDRLWPAGDTYRSHATSLRLSREVGARERVNNVLGRRFIPKAHWSSLVAAREVADLPVRAVLPTA